MNKLVFGVIFLIIILGGGYFAAKALKHTIVSPSALHQQSAQPTTSPSSTTMSPETMQKITVEGNEFAFNPSNITVKVGQTVQLTFKNTGQYPHNFTLSDLSVQTKTIQSSQVDTITFTPTKTGNFAYVCTVPGHADRGMKGTLTVQ